MPQVDFNISKIYLQSSQKNRLDAAANVSLYNSTKNMNIFIIVVQTLY